MLDYIKIAWRNLWRNRARTVIITIVVFFVVILATMMSSQQYGIYDGLEKNIVDFAGHIQVQDTAYWEKKTLDNTLRENDDILSSLQGHEDVLLVTRRIESGGLVSYGTKTKGIAVVGFEPETENAMADLKGKVEHYRLSKSIVDSAILLIADTLMHKPMLELSRRTYISVERLEKDLASRLPEELIDTVSVLIQQLSKTRGQYLAKNDKGVLLGSKLAQYLGVQEGDSIVLLSQGYHGVSANGLFPVRGVLKIADPKLNRSLIYMEINTCQELYSAENQLSSYLIKLKAHRDLTTIANQIEASLSEDYTALSWKDMSPEFVQQIESDKAGGIFMKGIFYMIIGFIIFGTVKMMIAERSKEFGIMVAIGMHKYKIAIILFFETLFISALGVIAGTLLSLPIVTLLHNNPIPLQGEMAEMMEDYGYEAVIYFSNAPDIFYTQAVVVFIMTLVITVFSFISIARLNVIEALRK